MPVFPCMVAAPALSVRFPGSELPGARVCGVSVPFFAIRADVVEFRAIHALAERLFRCALRLLLTTSEVVEVRLDEVLGLVSLETVWMPAKEHDTKLEHLLVLFGVRGIGLGCESKVGVFA